eukprot:15337114-Ditylum_brightwellii.AAC.2
MIGRLLEAKCDEISHNDTYFLKNCKSHNDITYYSAWYMSFVLHDEEIYYYTSPTTATALNLATQMISRVNTR